tara:strand:- start:1010 stop:2002 length:993 start_codon:yes stop_codon:yes gene_type:complete
MMDFTAYKNLIEGRLNQNKVPATVDNTSIEQGDFDFTVGNNELTDEFLVNENLNTFTTFLLDEFLIMLQDSMAGGLVPIEENATDTEINTFDENQNEISFNNKTKFYTEALPILKELLEKDEVDLTVDKYRNLVAIFAYYFQFLSFDKEVNGSTNPNAVPTAGTFVLEAAKDLHNSIGNTFKQAFVDLDVYEYYEGGQVVPGSEIKIRTMIPSKFTEAIKQIADSCKGSFLGQDISPTKTITETKNPKQMEKLRALLDSPIREIMGTNITKDDVGTPKPDGSGLWIMNDMKNEVIGTYEVEPSEYTVSGNNITYQLSDPILVEEQWTGIK